MASLGDYVETMFNKFKAKAFKRVIFGRKILRHPQIVTSL